MQFDVKIRKVIENGKPLKALASVTVDGSFTIHNVRVIKTENAQFVAMPYIPLARSECTLSCVYIPELQGSGALFGRRGA